MRIHLLCTTIRIHEPGRPEPASLGLRRSLRIRRLACPVRTLGACRHLSVIHRNLLAPSTLISTGSLSQLCWQRAPKARTSCNCCMRAHYSFLQSTAICPFRLKTNQSLFPYKLGAFVYTNSSLTPAIPLAHCSAAAIRSNAYPFPRESGSTYNVLIQSACSNVTGSGYQVNEIPPASRPSDSTSKGEGNEGEPSGWSKECSLPHSSETHWRYVSRSSAPAEEVTIVVIAIPEAYKVGD